VSASDLGGRGPPNRKGRPTGAAPLDGANAPGLASRSACSESGPAAQDLIAAEIIDFHNAARDRFSRVTYPREIRRRGAALQFFAEAIEYCVNAYNSDSDLHELLALANAIRSIERRIAECAEWYGIVGVT
jgi:hypothetical protein